MKQWLSCTEPPTFHSHSSLKVWLRGPCALSPTPSSHCHSAHMCIRVAAANSFLPSHLTSDKNKKKESEKQLCVHIGELLWPACVWQLLWASGRHTKLEKRPFPIQKQQTYYLQGLYHHCNKLFVFFWDSLHLFSHQVGALITCMCAHTTHHSGLPICLVLLLRGQDA